MNYDELPEFSIIYTDSRIDKNVNYEAQISFSSHPIRLYVNIAYFDIKSDNTRATMMHEFTHLYDYIILSERYGSDFVITHFKMYTEFHASQMEILYLHHLIDNINDNIEKYIFQKRTH